MSLYDDWDSLAGGIGFGLSRAAIYTRYSSHMQNKRSTDDQVFQCNEAASQNGWTVDDAHVRSDEEKTGRTLHGRNGLADLLDLAKTKPRPFDVLIVDDPSRLGRDQADALNILKRLKFHGVELYIVSYRLCSNQPYFREMFSQMSRRAEEESIQHGWRVRRGKKGRFRDGYHPGGACYGYTNEPIEDTSRRGVHGRFEVIGCKQRINDQQASVVRRIFSDYIAGRSSTQIARTLNAEGVAPPQGARTRAQASWSKEAMLSILTNERYIGNVYWNKSYQVPDPDTGKMKSRLRPEHEVMYRHDEELRIISDQVFEAAKAQRKRQYRDNGLQALGGMARTAAARQYLLSGLLKCGVCGHNMPVLGGNPVYYGCKMYRQRGTCSNSVTIRLDVLEQALADGLTSIFKNRTFQTVIVEELSVEVQRLQKSDEVLKASLMGQTESLREERRRLVKMADNLVSAIAQTGNSAIMSARVVKIEARVKEIDGLLLHAHEKVTEPIGWEELAAFVSGEVSRLAETLFADRELAKNQLRRLIPEIVMMPFNKDGVRGYYITGSVDLFLGAEDVMQEDRIQRKPLHYTFALQIKIEGSRRKRVTRARSAKQGLRRKIQSILAGENQHPTIETSAANPAWNSISAGTMSTCMSESINSLSAP